MKKENQSLKKLLKKLELGGLMMQITLIKFRNGLRRGFLGRISLNEILYELDSRCSEILRHNAKYILRTFDNPDQPSDESTRAFIKAIVVTRNYYLTSKLQVMEY